MPSDELPSGWDTLRGADGVTGMPGPPTPRPQGSNADEWHLFLAENNDNLAFLAVQIAEAIDEAEKRGPR